MTILDDLEKQVYLSDGVYAHHDGYQIWLATDGNAIALEPGVMQALLDYKTHTETLIHDHLTTQHSAKVQS